MQPAKKAHATVWIAFTAWSLVINLPVARQTEPWHQSEHYKHEEVNGTRDPVSATDVLDKGLTLEGNHKPQLGADRESQRKEPHYQRSTTQMHFGEAPQNVTCCEKNCGRHDGHFRQFSPALSNAWNEEWNAHDAEYETSAKHECEIHEPGADGYWHGCVLTWVDCEI